MMLGRQWRWAVVVAVSCAVGSGCATGSAGDDDAGGLFDDVEPKPTDDTGKKGEDTGEGEDAVVDTDVGTTNPDTGVGPDTGTNPMDSGVIDTGPVDTGVIDTGPVDTGVIDTGPMDTGPVDTGPVDTGPVDTGPVDTGPPDTGPVGIMCTNGLVSTRCAYEGACCINLGIPVDGGSIPLGALCGCAVPILGCVPRMFCE